ncbi:MAG TPA: serine/threonine-protein kinase [Polyangiaceae bacterium]|jgi:serine/threonine-protein kinase|nr:serine/threonine-protein kinase [Polyangiaceae bacterium]
MNKFARVKHPEERIGQLLLGKWRLDELLGIGAMAAVFSATHRNGKRVAIKILHGHLAEESVVVRRFLREGYAANRVGHPAVVSALDDNVTEDNCPFLVLDLVEGKPLDELVVRNGPMSPEQVLRIADQILDALAVAHDKGVLHRDLKPENFVLTSDEKVRILDFGIARVDEEGAVDPRITVQGRAMGTPGFMSPEQAAGLWEKVDARSDLWSLGATMFMLLTGREVHSALKAYELLIASITRQAPPIREVAPDVPEDVANLVDRALAFQPGDRFPSARVMQEWVRDAQDVGPPSGIPDAPPSQGPMLISQTNSPQPAVPGRMGRMAITFLAAAAASIALTVTATKLTGGARVPAWRIGDEPAKLGAVLPHDAASDIVEAPAKPKRHEITLPPIELDGNSIDLDEVPEDEDDAMSETPGTPKTSQAPRRPGKLVTGQFLAQASPRATQRKRVARTRR